jgi:hypothetical protein
MESNRRLVVRFLIVLWIVSAVIGLLVIIGCSSVIVQMVNSIQ